jgi:hypothetical protein
MPSPIPQLQTTSNIVSNSCLQGNVNLTWTATNSGAAAASTAQRYCSNQSLNIFGSGGVSDDGAFNDSGNLRGFPVLNGGIYRVWGWVYQAVGGNIIGVGYALYRGTNQSDSPVYTNFTPPAGQWTRCEVITPALQSPNGVVNGIAPYFIRRDASPDFFLGEYGVSLLPSADDANPRPIGGHGASW